MATFVKLTVAKDGKPTLVNLDQVSFARPEGAATRIYFEDPINNFDVKETLEEIAALADARSRKD